MVIAWSAIANAAELYTCGDLPVEPCFDTIQDAIDASAPGDTVHLTEGEWAEAITIAHDLTLVGDEGHVLRDPFGVENVITVTGGQVTLRSLILVTNAARAIFATDADLRVEDGTYQSVGLQYRGGILAIEGGTLLIFGAEFQGGSAYEGGQVHASGTPSVIVAATQFEGGAALSDGGCLSLVGGGDGAVVSVGATFVGCTARAFGGGMHVEDAAVSVHGASFSGCRAWGGGGMYVFRGSLVAEAIHLLDNVATGDGGGIATQDAYATIGTSEIRRNQAGISGGGVAARGGLSVTDTVFLGNTASGTGGAAYAWALSISRARFCANVSGGGGAAIYLTDDAAPALIENSVFGHNVAGTAHAATPGGAVGIAEPRTFGSARLDVRFNTFVGNTGAGTSAVDLSGAAGREVDVSSNLFVDNVATVVPDSDLSTYVVRPAPGALVRYNLWWNNAADAPAAGTGVEVDPRLVDWTEAGCEVRPVGLNWRDQAWPSWYGGGRDAGDPAVRDRDETVADVGVTGGPRVPDFWWEDDDDDGYPTVYDCDPTTATTHPEAEDVPYDGLDANCDSWSDDDADHDGWNVDDECNDTDATIAPDAVDVPYDGLDQDCEGGDANDLDGDGWTLAEDCDDTDGIVHPGQTDRDPDVDRDCDGQVTALQPRGCATAAPVPLAWLAAIFAVRRRYSSAPKPSVSPRELAIR